MSLRILRAEEVGNDWLIRTLEGWQPGAKEFVWRLLSAAVIVAVGIYLARQAVGLLKKTLARAGVDENVARFLLTVARMAFYAVVLFVAVERLGVPSSSIVAVVGSAGLAVGLSLKESLNNVAGGILILVTRPFVLQDYILCGDVEGTVTAIGLVYTTLASVDNRKITIPNGTISNATVVNYTAQEKRQLDLVVSVSYQADLRRAKEVLLEILEEHPQIIQEDGTRVFVKELGESAVLLGVRGWTRTEDYWPVRWDIIETIKLRFDEEGIEIPYSQMDVHIQPSNKTLDRK